MDIMQMFPQPHPQTAGRVIDGEAVLILSDSSEVNVINEVGSRIFELADGTRSIAQIAAIVAAEFDGDVDEICRDTLDFVKNLVAEDVLTLNPKPEQ